MNKTLVFLVLCVLFLACAANDDAAFKAKVNKDLAKLIKEEKAESDKANNEKKKETKNYEKQVSENKKTEKTNDAEKKKQDNSVKQLEKDKQNAEKKVKSILTESYEPKITGKFPKEPVNTTLVTKHEVKLMDTNIKLNIPKSVEKTESLFPVQKVTKKANTLAVLDNLSAFDEEDVDSLALDEEATSLSYTVNANTAGQFETLCNAGTGFKFFDMEISKCQKKDANYIIDFQFSYKEVIATAWQGAPESKTKTLNLKNAELKISTSNIVVTANSDRKVDDYGTFLSIENGKYTLTFADGSDVEIKENGAAKIWKFPSFANAETITAGGALAAKAYFTQKEFSIATLVPILKNTPLESLLTFDAPVMTFTSGGTETLLPYGFILRGEFHISTNPILLFIKTLFKLSDDQIKSKLHPGVILKFFRPEDIKGLGAFIEIDIPTIPIIPKHLELIAPFRYEIGLNLPTFNQRLSCIFRVNFPYDKSTLRFLMYFQVGPFPVNNEIQGGAESMDAWVDPFGIKGLTVSKIALDVGFNLAIQPVNIVKFGFLGRITLPEVGEIEAGVMQDLSEVEHPKSILVAGIQKFSITALAKLIGKLTGVKVLAKLPDISFRDVKLVVAPMGGDIGSTQFAPGVQLRGSLTFGKIEVAAVNVAISTSLTSALFTDYLCYIDGRSKRIDLGPIVIEESIVKVRVAIKELLFHIYGYISIFGNRMGCEVTLSPKGFHLVTENAFTKLEIQIEKKVSFVKGMIKPKPLNDISNAINYLVKKFTEKLSAAVSALANGLSKGLSKIKIPKIKEPKICKKGKSNTLDYSGYENALEKIQSQIDILENEYNTLAEEDVDELDVEAVNTLIFRRIKRGLRRAGRAIKKTTKKAGRAIKKTTKKAGRAIKNTAKKAGRAIKKVGKSIKDFAKKYGKELKEAGLSGYEKLKDVSEATYKKYSKKLLDEVKKLKKLKDKLKKELKKFKDEMKKKLNKFKDMLCKKTSGLIKGMNKQISKANSAVQKAAKSVKSISGKMKIGGATPFKLKKAEIAATVKGVFAKATFTIKFEAVLFGKTVKLNINVKVLDTENAQEYLKKQVMSTVKKVFNKLL